jgi:hypothetical protein
MTLVPRPLDHNVIDTKWVFKNKSDEHGTVIGNRARLVAQGYTQIEGVDFDETFAPVPLRVHPNLAVHCLPYQVQTLSDGCQECLSKWHTSRRSVC